MLKSRFELNFEQVYLDAKGDGVAERLEDELASFAELLRQHYDFKLFLEDPRVPAQDKKKYFKKLCPSGVTKNFVALVELLVDHGREELISGLSDSFTKELARDQKIIFGRVASVCALPAKTRKKLEQVVSQWQQSPVRLRYDLEPELLGGLRLKFISGKVWDLSLKYKLNSFKEAILAE